MDTARLSGIAHRNPRMRIDGDDVVIEFDTFKPDPLPDTELLDVLVLPKGLRVRVLNALQYQPMPSRFPPCKTIRDVKLAGRRKLLRYRGMGERGLAALESALERRGHVLTDDGGEAALTAPVPLVIATLQDEIRTALDKPMTAFALVDEPIDVPVEPLFKAEFLIGDNSPYSAIVPSESVLRNTIRLLAQYPDTEYRTRDIAEVLREKGVRRLRPLRCAVATALTRLRLEQRVVRHCDNGVFWYAINLADRRRLPC